MPHDIWQILLIGVGLSMDALAVSLALGATGRGKITRLACVVPALFFGGFQALMPICGWLAGRLLPEALLRHGNLLAAGLIAVVGAKMLYEKEEESSQASLRLWPMTVLAFATAIDALFVGVSFACLHRPAILGEAALIGGTTALISGGGYLAGGLAARALGQRAGILGGGMLLAISLKILLNP